MHAQTTTAPACRKWPRNPEFAEPVNPMDLVLRYRAQSILHSIVPYALPETPEQARDVIRWHEAALAA